MQTQPQALTQGWVRLQNRLVGLEAGDIKDRESKLIQARLTNWGRWAEDNPDQLLYPHKVPFMEFPQRGSN